MRRGTLVPLGIVMLATLAGTAAAQVNVARMGTERNRIYTTFGFDPALVSTLGYGRVTTIFQHDFLLSGDLGIVTAHLDTRDFRGRTGVQTSLWTWRSVRASGSMLAIVRGTENSIYRGINIGADVTGAIGVYKSGWFSAFELGKDKDVLTHVTHSDWYRKYYYAEAKDGWYLDAGGVYHFGFAGGVSWGATDIGARFGWRRSEGGEDVAPPIYASLSLARGY